MDIKKYYDGEASTYDLLVKRYHWNVKSWLPPVKKLSDCNVLDVACGTGHLCDLIDPAENNITVHGCDFSEKMLKESLDKDCYEVLYEHDLNNDWPNEVKNMCNNEKFVIPELFYDYAFCFGAFEYLKIDTLINCIENIFKQIKPKGKLVFNTHRIPHPYIADIIPHDLGELLSRVQKYCDVERIDPTTAYRLDPDTTVEYLIWYTVKK